MKDYAAEHKKAFDGIKKEVIKQIELLRDKHISGIYHDEWMSILLEAAGRHAEWMCDEVRENYRD